MRVVTRCAAIEIHESVIPRFVGGRSRFQEVSELLARGARCINRNTTFEDIRCTEPDQHFYAQAKKILQSINMNCRTNTDSLTLA